MSEDEEGGIPADDQLLGKLEVQTVQGLRKSVQQLAAGAWAQNNLPLPQVSPAGCQREVLCIQSSQSAAWV